MTDPALIFETAVAGPATHVLLIGVGDYPWLVGGTSEDADNAQGMAQLAAPPRSMRALADWFIADKFVNPDRPLASLALVLSEPKPARYTNPKTGARSNPLPRGTAEDVKGAIRAWVDRADDDPDHLLIFAFCGHGVSAGNSVLLCRDYASIKNARFNGAINFNHFYATVQSFTPNHQLFFIDACRTPDGVVNAMMGMPSVGQTVLDARPMDQRGGTPALQSIHFATSPHTQSWGRTKGLSLYTEALLRALNGGGSQPDLQDWVGTNGLQAALAAYTSRIAKIEGVEQAPDRTSSPNFRVHFPAEIKLPVYFRCAPHDVWKVPCSFEAKSSISVHPGVKHKPAKVAGIDPAMISYEMDLPIETYDFAACFGKRAPYFDAVKRKTVFPPLAECSFEIEKRP